MKKSCVYLGLLLLDTTSIFCAAKNVGEKIDTTGAVAALTYLTPDELMGRDPIRPGISLAYNFIADQLKNLVLKPIRAQTAIFHKYTFL